MDPRLSRGLHNLKEMFFPFGKLWLALALLAGVSLAVLAVQYAYPGPACTVEGASYPWTQCWLADSTRTPWGIVTAFFVHLNFEPHYLYNMAMLFALVLVFCVSCAGLPLKEKSFRQRVFLWVMFIAGVVANIASLFLYGPNPGFGASGLDFAAWGIVLIFSVTNLVPRVERLSDFIPYYTDLGNLAWTLGNLLLALILILAPVEYPALFLSVGPHVNVLVHFVGIVFAMGFTIVWYLLHYHKVGRWGKEAGGTSGKV